MAVRIVELGLAAKDVAFLENRDAALNGECLAKSKPHD